MTLVVLHVPDPSAICVATFKMSAPLYVIDRLKSEIEERMPVKLEWEGKNNGSFSFEGKSPVAVQIHDLLICVEACFGKVELMAMSQYGKEYVFRQSPIERT